MQIQLTEVSDRLRWNNGVGELPFETPVPYDEAYFHKYIEYENSVKGKGITDFRVGMVQKMLCAEEEKLACLDIGIGSGHFMKELKKNTDLVVEGLDINKVAKKWMKTHGYSSKRKRYDILTFWDVLEHIPEPWRLWENYNPKYLAVSIPLFKDKEHAINSRHFRPEEHWWYFTLEGFMTWMGSMDWEICAYSTAESTKWGREDIFSFGFRRKVRGGHRW
jgi:hypothetical protein